MSPLRVMAFVFAALGAANTFGQADLATKIDSPAPPAGAWTRGKWPMAKAESAPKIDGKLDDPCWKSATRGQGFFRFLSNDPVKEQTEVWFCADKEQLYVAFHCIESHPESIQARETQRNGNLNQDDRVAILIDSQSTKHSGSVFWVNARGTQMQEMEGGTADNQAWQGDWHAATSKTGDGWLVEMAIPFRLLRYPKGAKSFGMFVVRRKATETNFTCWPYMPPQSDTGSVSQYVPDFDGLDLPTYAPRPTILPYMLSTAGQGTSTRFGLDVKYPISTTLTGLATIKPDFQTVEGAVTDLSFSYTEKFVPDRRPFFAEGGGFLDDSFLFYSQRIPNVDYGFKVTGKTGPTTIGVLATAATTGDEQNAMVATFDQELSQYGTFGGTFLQSHQTGSPGGQVAQIRGGFGSAKGMRNYVFWGNMTQGWQQNGQEGHSLFGLFRSYAGKGQLNGNISYSSTSGGFANPLGLVSEVDTKGVNLNLNEFDVFDKGLLENRSFYMSASRFDHLDGTFFHDNFFLGSEISLRNGYGFSVNGSVGRRETFQDRSLSGSFNWNGKTLLSRGGVSLESGRRENKPYRFTSVSQGFPINKFLSFSLSLGQLELGTDKQTQTVLSGLYRVDPLQSFGGRMVSQGGKTNVYLSYGHKTRKGTDLFILLGDPNAETTRKSISLKMVWALGH